ncbi:hypothetical protein C8T65DRAFT_656655 [Cerioporus squamosus]|nr:hypothetical protein C8T65DRAFT_656655 [Cerioporus squamosus]
MQRCAGRAYLASLLQVLSSAVVRTLCAVSSAHGQTYSLVIASQRRVQARTHAPQSAYMEHVGGQGDDLSHLTQAGVFAIGQVQTEEQGGEPERKPGEEDMDAKYVD